MLTRTDTAERTDNDEAIVNINGYALSTRFDDGVERVRDIELAQRLGYARVRDIRALIRGMCSAGKLSNVAQSGVAPRRQDGLPSKPATEFWLTEAQALKVIAKCETAAADAILDEVIEVFIAWRHGRLDSLSVSGGALMAMQKQLIALQAEVALLRDGRITRATHDQLKADVKRIAACEVAARRWETTKAASCDIYRELREMTGWGGRGQSWRIAPAGLAHPAGVVLRGRDMSIQRELKLLSADRQMCLPGTLQH